MFKKLTALLLAFVMTLFLSACGENKSNKKEEKIKDAVVKQALDLIDKGSIEEAYDLLYNIKEQNEEQEELFQKFVWVQVEETRIENETTIFNLKSNYNANGYLLSNTVIDRDDAGSYNEKLTYNADDDLLSYEYTNNGTVYRIDHTYDKKGNMLSSKYGEHITENFTYHNNGKIASYTYKTPDNAATLYGIYGPQLFTVTYNQEGKPLKEKTISNQNGKASSTETIYSYDSQGNLLTESTTGSDGYWSKEINTYDKNGNLLTHNLSSSYNVFKSEICTYDKYGHISTRDVTSEGGVSSESDNYSQKYTYDENGNILSEHTYYNGGAWEKLVYTYHSNGYKLTQTYTDSYHNNKTFTYDNNGNILTYSNFSSNKNNDFWEKEIYTYDVNKNLLTSSKTKSTGEFEHIYNTYDNDGRIINCNESTNLGTNTKTYEYDKDGNQICEENGYTVTRNKYGYIIKSERNQEDAYDDFGFPVKNTNYYSTYELFYYPNGAPWAFDAVTCHLSTNPRTEYFEENPITKKRENLPTSNFYYSRNS